MGALGKLLVLSGVLLAVVGLFFIVADKIGWLGRLPGDIAIKRGNFTFYFPLATCLIISLVVTLLLWFFRR